MITLENAQGSKRIVSDHQENDCSQQLPLINKREQLWMQWMSIFCLETSLTQNTLCSFNVPNNKTKAQSLTEFCLEGKTPGDLHVQCQGAFPNWPGTMND